MYQVVLVHLAHSFFDLLSPQILDYLCIYSGRLELASLASEVLLLLMLPLALPIK